jgi:hypothetical protein
VFHRLLLLPLLSPLLVTLLVGALNSRPSVVLRLLTWQTPALPIGLWMAMAAGGGAALSGGVTALALQQGSRAPRSRSGRSTEIWEAEAWQPPQRRAASTQEPFFGRRTPDEAAAPRTPSAGPSRAPGEPSPTVSVPYRVLHRPEGSSNEVAETTSRVHAGGSFRSDATAHANHGTGPEHQDWDDADSEDW